MVFSRPVRLVA